MTGGDAVKFSTIATETVHVPPGAAVIAAHESPTVADLSVVVQSRVCVCVRAETVF